MNSTPSVAATAFRDALNVLRDLEFDDPRSTLPLQMERLDFPLHTRERYEIHGEFEFRDDLAKPRPPRKLTTAPTIVQARRDLDENKVSCIELLEDSIAAMNRVKDLGAIVYFDEGVSRSQAKTLDRELAKGQLRGPLHGIPLSVKDIIDVANMQTLGGSLAYQGHPDHDAQSVGILRQAGALLFAKAATHEFALGVTTPQCRNPYDPTRISGGSSGGSAIAVSCGIGLGSLGTDTRASLRVPASLCGVVGFKPSFDAVPTKGIVPLSWTIDHIGPIARTVADAWLILEILMGRDPTDPFPARTGQRKIVLGVLDFALLEADDEVAGPVAAAIRELIGPNYKIENGTGVTKRDFEVANALGLLVSRSEASAFHRGQGTNLDLCIDEVRDQLRAAADIRAVDYLDAQRQRKILGEKVMSAFENFDVLVMPTTPVVAPPHSDYENYLLRLSRNAILWSLMGNPAISIPCGSTASGLPVGLQLVAAPGNEALLARVGIDLERRLGTNVER